MPEDFEQSFVASCTLRFFFFDQEKERELDAKNIYSNRLVKPALRKDGESSAKRKRKSLLRKKTDKQR